MPGVQNAFTVNLLAAKHFFSKRCCQGAGRKSNLMQWPTLPLFFLEGSTSAGRKRGSQSVLHQGPARPQGKFDKHPQSQAELGHHKLCSLRTVDSSLLPPAFQPLSTFHRERSYRSKERENYKSEHLLGSQNVKSTVSCLRISGE